VVPHPRRAEPAAAEPQGHVDESDEDRHLDQRADDAGQRLAGRRAEHADGDGDRQLEVVRRGREGERRRAGVAEAQRAPEREREEEHRHEVHEQRQRDEDDVERPGGDRLALDGEQHHDREQQPVERERADARQEPLLVPRLTAPLEADPSREVAGGQRDPEEDQHGAGDLPQRHVEALRVQPEHARQAGEIEPAEQRVGDDLEQRVDRDEQRRRLVVGLRHVAPDQHHRDAAGEPHDDQPGAVLRLVGEEGPREREHQRRPDDPVEHQRRAHQPPLTAQRPSSS